VPRLTSHAPSTSRRRALAPLLLAIATAAAPLPSFARSSEPASATSRGWAHVAVDTSGVGEAGPVLRRRVQERADVVLRRAGVMPGRGPKDPTISVVIKEITGDEPSWEYSITLSRSDTPAQAAPSQSCPLCTETELVEAIEGKLATIAADLETQVETPDEPTTDPTEDPSDDTKPVPIATTDDTSKGKLGKKGKAGAALVGLGVAGVAVGIVLVVLPDRPKSGDPTREVFTQPPGYALLATGAVSLVVGAVLLGIDRKQAKRSGRKQARIRLAPGGVVRF